jgi:S1-C subfamily serine protease
VVAGASLALAAGPLAAQPLSPTELYAKAAPSVWRVQTYDADNLPLGLGSGVVVEAEALVTNCHVLAKARRVTVRREGGRALPARLVQWDPPRDVCRLQVAGLTAPAVELVDSAQLQVGQPVYAIGNPKGLDLTMSAGLLSSIRRNDRQQTVLLQTSAAISGGSSGGGLFDEQGRLIGLTTIGSVVGDAQNLNFAIPAEWVRDLPRRHALLQAPRGAASAPANP